MVVKQKRKTTAKKTSNVLPSKNSIARNRAFSKLQVAIIAGALALIGLVVVIYSFAATSPNWETEGWSLSSATGAKTVLDASASNGQYLEFLPAPKPSGFVHPGIMDSKNDLDFVKAKIARGEQPWANAFNTMKASSYASTNFTPRPVAEIKCSASNYATNPKYPQIGCGDSIRDASAAYTQALMYYYTGNEVYAQNTIKIINAWSSTLKGINFDYPREVNGEPVYSGNSGPQIYANGKLQAAWTAELMTRGAEIVRYTYKSPTTGGWSDADIARAENMFKTVHLVTIGNGWTGGGNWETSMAEAMTNIGIFSNDKATYDKGISYWREQTKALIYLDSDNRTFPYPPSSVYTSASAVAGRWNNPSRYVNGLSMETCRDLGHMMMGMGAMTNTAETALIQGTNLYADEKERIIAAYETNSAYTNQFLDYKASSGLDATTITNSGWAPSQNWVCPDFKDGGGSLYLGFEVAYNHFAGRLGISMPNTKKAVERMRPSTSGNHMIWETLTHAGVPLPE